MPFAINLLFIQCKFPVLSQTLLNTFFSGLRDDVSSTLAHDTGYVERTVGLAGNGYGSEHGLSFQLQRK